MTSAVSPGAGTAAAGSSGVRAVEREIGRYWWLWLVTGVAWVFAALVILQFDAASITTIGIIVGCMFVFAGAQQLVLATLADRLRWLWAIVGVLFLVFGVVCFANPENTFAGLADLLGFLFLTVGVWWIISAFLQQSDNPVWWLGLISGILMCMLAFWTAGQFFLEKAYTLLVFAGIWALMHGVTDIVRAFRVRMARDLS